MIFSILISCGTSRKLTTSKKILDNPLKAKIHSEEKMSNQTKILSNKEKIQLYITQYSSIAKKNRAQGYSSITLHKVF